MAQPSLPSPHPHLRQNAWTKPTPLDILQPTITTLPPEKPDFNPSKIPPDWSLADLHAVRCIQNAKKVLVLKAKFAEDGEEVEDFCPCCHFPHTGKEFEIGCDVRTLAELGEGFPLYFDLVKWVAFLLALCFVVAGCFCMYRNYSADSLRSNYILRGSLANYGSSSPSISEPSLHLCALVLLLLAHEFIVIRHEKMQTELDKHTVTPSDYTVMVRDLPKKELDRTELWRFLERESRLVGSM